VAKGDVQYKISDNTTDEEAATLGVGITTVGQGLYQSLQLPLPGSGKAGIWGKPPASTPYSELFVDHSPFSGFLLLQKFGYSANTHRDFKLIFCAVTCVWRQHCHRKSSNPIRHPLRLQGNNNMLATQLSFRQKPRRHRSLRLQGPRMRQEGTYIPYKQ
jgi:hypothetical protein